MARPWALPHAPFLHDVAGEALDNRQRQHDNRCARQRIRFTVPVPQVPHMLGLFDAVMILMKAAAADAQICDVELINAYREANGQLADLRTRARGRRSDIARYDGAPVPSTIS